jgi:peptide/nickel transport system substrate-binding protein
LRSPVDKRTGISEKSAGLTGALLISGLLLAACAATPAIASPLAAAQQDVTVAEGPDFQQTEPPDQATVGLDPTVGMLEGLVGMDADFHLRPLLATSWEFLAPSTWRFHLRRGVHFHDGRLFTADAVRWSVEGWMQSGPQNYLALGPGAQVVTRDTYTVDIETVVPDRRLVEALADQRRAIVAPGTYPGDGRTPASTPDGTGPFRFVQYLPGRELVLAGFSGYWGGAPRLSRLTIRYYADPAQGYAALRNGTAQLAVDLGPAQAADLEKRGDLKLARSAVTGADLLFFNLLRPAEHPLVQDAVLRQAIALAIDQPAIVDQAWDGFGARLDSLVVPTLAGRSAPAAPTASLAAARRLLDQDGWRVGPDGIRVRNGLRLHLQVALGDLSERTLTARLLGGELASAGISADITEPDDDTFFNQVLGAGNYDLVGLGFIGQRDANPLGILSYLSPAPGGCNFCIFANLGPAFDQRFAQAVAGDDATARRVANTLSRVVLNDQAAVILLAGKSRLYGLSRAVQDFTAQPKDPDYAPVWLAAS